MGLVAPTALFQLTPLYGSHVSTHSSVLFAVMRCCLLLYAVSAACFNLPQAWACAATKKEARLEERALEVGLMRLRMGNGSRHQQALNNLPSEG